MQASTLSTRSPPLSSSEAPESPVPPPSTRGSVPESTSPSMTTVEVVHPAPYPTKKVPPTSPNTHGESFGIRRG